MRNYTFKFKFFIEPNKKIEICVTWIGKSIITLCLFRILESIYEKILIVDINIHKINLDKLKSSLTIISQDPYLFQSLNQYSRNFKNFFKKLVLIMGFNIMIISNF